LVLGHALAAVALQTIESTLVLAECAKRQYSPAPGTLLFIRVADAISPILRLLLSNSDFGLCCSVVKVLGKLSHAFAAVEGPAIRSPAVEVELGNGQQRLTPGTILGHAAFTWPRFAGPTRPNVQVQPQFPSTFVDNSLPFSK
jgi:hypothetical protein